MTEERLHLIETYFGAIEAVQPSRLLPKFLSLKDGVIEFPGGSFPIGSGKIYVIGAGKASCAMAVSVEMILGKNINRGIVTTKYGHTLSCKRIKTLEAAHPVPDKNGVEAARRTWELLREAGANDLVICLISGGASALWCDVPPGLELSDLQSTFDSLVHSGAAIGEINSVRKHLSNLKGGQLLRACPNTRVVSFCISDVPDDDLSVIASGPTVPDPTSFDDAWQVIEKYELESRTPANVLSHLSKGRQGLIPETPKPGDTLFDKVTNHIIANNLLARTGAAEVAASLGYNVLALPTLVTGDAEEEARAFLLYAKENLHQKPFYMLQGGEPTVRVRGQGKGGRAQHFVLAVLALLLQPEFEELQEHITVLAAGTDGTDGATSAAGAIADLDTLYAAENLDISIAEILEEYNSYVFFEHTQSLLKTGPTQTNVMDIMAALII